MYCTPWWNLAQVTKNSSRSGPKNVATPMRMARSRMAAPQQARELAQAVLNSGQNVRIGAMDEQLLDQIGSRLKLNKGALKDFGRGRVGASGAGGWADDARSGVV